MSKKKPATANVIDRINRPALRGMPKLPIRPGATEILAKPSRIGNTLFYPDGRVVKHD